MDQPHTEEQLAQELGMSRDEVKRLRGQHLKLGHDYSTQRGMTILTSSGRAKLLGLVSSVLQAAKAAVLPSSAPAPTDPAPVVQEAVAAVGEASATSVKEVRSMASGPLLLMDKATEESSGVVGLVVKRLPINRRILLAESPQGVLVRVRVKTSANFVPGMKIRGVVVQGDLYDYVGRLPRYRGKF